ncbi:MAG: carboxynorspermidine decarboxylase [Dysgonamonadaceae bacterium]|jgi:carboxynorspermidine decarboxylase|nr:carboxynorspermidine decarboxylase [Dysgonamonadaceae bacterium]
MKKNPVISPSFVIEESLLRQNLEILKSVSDRSGADILIALKAFAAWKIFPIIREYFKFAAASSSFEARLAAEELGGLAHTCSPAYTNENFDEIMNFSSHITFNSLAQFEKFIPQIQKHPYKISCGLRINPEYSDIKTEIYNPAAPGSRLGITRSALGKTLPEGIEGLHFHAMFESSSVSLENTLKYTEARFGDLFHQIKWLNIGGGHNITNRKYDTGHLVSILTSLKERYPNLQVILEPGAAFVLNAGYLLATVVDVVESNGIKTAILDISFTCHAPDCLEMPYKPVIQSAYPEPVAGKPTYRLGGNSCLSGDFIGEYSFKKELHAGSEIKFLDMIQYTTVKTTMFNGIQHPNICLNKEDGYLRTLRRFTYNDYKNRMD